MRTNIEIDNKLMKQAMKATGTATKRAAVEAALRKVVELKKQAKIRELFGKVVWRGPDDDWSASDEEILKNRKVEQDREPTDTHAPAGGPHPAMHGEQR